MKKSAVQVVTQKAKPTAEATNRLQYERRLLRVMERELRRAQDVDPEEFALCYQVANSQANRSPATLYTFTAKERKFNSDFTLNSLQRRDDKTKDVLLKQFCQLLLSYRLLEEVRLNYQQRLEQGNDTFDGKDKFLSSEKAALARVNQQIGITLNLLLKFREYGRFSQAKLDPFDIPKGALHDAEVVRKLVQTYKETGLFEPRTPYELPKAVKDQPTRRHVLKAAAVMAAVGTLGGAGAYVVNDDYLRGEFGKLVGVKPAKPVRSR